MVSARKKRADLRNSTPGSSGLTPVAPWAKCCGPRNKSPKAVPGNGKRPRKTATPRWTLAADSQRRLASLRQAARRAALAARQELQQIASLIGLCRQFAAMDFRFLFHPQRKLLAVGFNVSEGRRDESYYDLLASEARLTSFLAVSHGQLPREHWQALGRMVTVAGGTPALLSSSGSMFEYLLPMLIMPSYRATLLDATCRAAVNIRSAMPAGTAFPGGFLKAAPARAAVATTMDIVASACRGWAWRRTWASTW